jgi:tubulin polyglutamylase TTLL6/13
MPEPLKSKSNEEITFLAGEVCLYSVVKRSASSLGWKLIDETAPDKVKQNCHVIWVDKSFVNDKLFLSLQRWQRINHFPGMTHICRKTRLAHNLEIMRKKFPSEFNFHPLTFILPQNYLAFKSLFVNGQSKQPFIIKPDGSAQGKGIFITNRLEDVQDLQMSCVAQQYIKNPLLIDNKKFDLRIYLLVTSCSPLRLVSYVHLIYTQVFDRSFILSYPHIIYLSSISSAMAWFVCAQKIIAYPTAAIWLIAACI